MQNIHRVESFDELDEVKRLRSRNKELKEKLAKKYRHVSQLEKRISQLEGMVLISQSGVVGDEQPPPGVSEMEMSPMTSEQITSFADQDAGWTTEKVGMYDPTMDLANNNDSELGNFLKRPIRESAQTWLVGQPFFYKFNPWAAFCENSFVRDKIKNYELLRMKLHVKMVISGTKFHYGRSLVSYNPYTAGDQVTVDRNFITQDLIQASQKPHFYLNPTKNTGGELCLPFFWPQNYLSIPDADWDDMGEIVISSFGNLLHANGGDDPVTITTYIWAEDVVLTIPTSSDPPLASQSGRRGRKNTPGDQANTINSKDEYGQGIISKPAAAIAKAAGALSNLPVIGPYMTATQIGANATSKIAQMFGYSRPNVITDIAQFKPTPAGNLANTDAADAAMKLTLDSKAELTVDSRTAGLDGTDEMGILDYVKRESYLTQFAWNPNKGPDELLWNTRVLPMQLDNIQGEIHMTPLAHMATAFEQWQGSIKFRFQIVKSDFHKGRILARWDPNQFTSAVQYNTNYSRVIDIAETDDFEIVVGWGQSVPWLSCGQPYSSGSNFSDVSRLLNNQGQENGILELTVLNDLVCPSIDSPISINVFVSACDDFKLAAPRNSVFNSFHLWPEPPVTQSSKTIIEELEEAEEILESQSSTPNVETGDTTVSDKPTAPNELMTIAKKSDQEDATYLVYYGDPPCSIRELCKRYSFTRFWYPTTASANALRINGLRNKNMPYHTGYDPNGIDVAQDAVTPLTVGPTAYSSWFTPAYAGVRGAFRKKYYFSAPLSRQTPIVSRDRFQGTGNGTFFNSEILLASGRSVIQKYLTSRWSVAGGNGTAATNLGVNNTIEVELPYYLPKRFSAARTISAQGLDCNSHRVATTDVNAPDFFANPQSYSTAYQQHDAVGEDFSLFFFTGVPIYYEYTMNEGS
jgi:hypothetical protein